MSQLRPLRCMFPLVFYGYLGGCFGAEVPNGRLAGFFFLHPSTSAFRIFSVGLMVEAGGVTQNLELRCDSLGIVLGGQLQYYGQRGEGGEGKGTLQ